MAAASAPGSLGEQLEKIVLARLAANKLTLPAMPAVATRCLEVLKDPAYQVRKLVPMIESEPLLASLVLRSANSAGAGGGVKTLDQALARVGETTLKSMITTYASRQLFRSNNRAVDEAGKRVWEHSLVVAQLARDLSALTGSADSETCYMAGLMHDIGKPIVAAMLLEAERSLGHGSAAWIDVSAWSDAITATHRKVGVALAAEWKLPDDITAGIRDCSDYDAADRTCVANIVRFANALAKREGFAAGPVDADDVSALLMVGRTLIGSDDDITERLVNGLKERAAKGLLLS